MNRFAGQSDVDTVREATDLLRLIGEHVVLKPRGREHIGLCPFHDDKNPSMAVVTHKGNAFYKCHSCGAGGDAFDFVMNYHRMEFGEALRHLAQKAGITLQARRREDDESTGPKRIDVKKANGYAATFFQRMLKDSDLGAAAREVIGQRGISDDMVQAFMLGAAPDSWDGLLNRIRRQNLPADVFVAAGLLKTRREGEGQYDAFRNRVVFPICDEMGHPIAFGARKINPEDEPKYLNSSESAIFNKSRTLYGLHLAKRAIIEKRTAIVTEGYTDVIACHQAGVSNAIATLGTALTREHARILSKLCDSVILLFDGDEAGMKAADRALEVFFSETVDIKICVLPDGLDPDELLKHDAREGRTGRERFDEAIAASTDALQYKLERFRHTLTGVSEISGRQKRLEGFLSELSQMGFGALQGVRKQMVLMRLADLMRLPVGAIEQALLRFTSVARKSAPDEQRAETEIESKPSFAPKEIHISRARRLAEFELLGIALYEPALALRLLAERASPSREVALDTPFEPSRFQNLAARSIAEVLLAHLRIGAAYTVQQVLADLEDEEHRKTASSLYFDGQRLCGDNDQCAWEALQSAAAALDACAQREQLDHALIGLSDGPDHALLRMQEILNHRRQAGHIASAIGRGARG